MRLRVKLLQKVNAGKTGPVIEAGEITTVIVQGDWWAILVPETNIYILQRRVEHLIQLLNAEVSA